MKSILLVMGLLLSQAEVPPDDAPPLVVRPNRYSFTFGVPSGWDLSQEQARQFGVPLVFLAVGSSFKDSSSVMYVNELCSNSCAGTLAGKIKEVLDRARADSPALRVSEQPPLKTKKGRAASVWVLEGARDPRQKREALAFVEYPEVVLLLVLSTRDTQGWVSDYEAFSHALAEHELFTCSSPDLRVPCDDKEQE